MKCKNCGSKLREGARFCPKCGCQVDPADYVRDKSRSKVLLLILAAVAVVAAVVVSVVLIRRGKSDDRSHSAPDFVEVTDAEDGIDDSSGELGIEEPQDDNSGNIYVLDRVNTYRNRFEDVLALNNIIDTELACYSIYDYNDDGSVRFRTIYTQKDDDYAGTGSASYEYESDGSYREIGPEGIRIYNPDGKLTEWDHIWHGQYFIDQYDEKGRHYHSDVDYNLDGAYDYEVSYEFDEEGRIIHRTWDEWDCTYEYDDVGRPVKITDTSTVGEIYVYSYSPSGALESATITYRDGSVGNISYITNAQGQVYKYTDGSEEHEIYDPLLDIPRYEYDDQGRITAYYEADHYQVIDCDYIKWEYDDQGRIAKETRGKVLYNFQTGLYSEVDCEYDEYIYKEMPVSKDGAVYADPGDYRIDPNNAPDYGNEQVLDYSRYNRGGDIGKFVYGYPASLFNSSSESKERKEGEIYGTRIRQNMYSGSDGSYACFNMYERTDESELEDFGAFACISEGQYLVQPGIVLNGPTKNDNGYIVIVTGYTDEKCNFSVYDLVKIEDEYVYNMKFYYPVSEVEQGYIDYYVECMYRLCEFGNHQSPPRSYEDFLAAR